MNIKDMTPYNRGRVCNECVFKKKKIDGGKKMELTFESAKKAYAHGN